ncbi:MAG: hypothetical protein AB8B93_06020 [Pseudomonadales bacterium]
MKAVVLALLVVTGACSQEAQTTPPIAAAQEPAAKELPAMAESQDPGQQALATFAAFVTSDLPQTPGLEADKRFAADLVARPPLEPSAYQQNKRELMAHLQQRFGEAHVDENLLYGSSNQLDAPGDCWVMVYESLMDGGVGGCVSGSPAQVQLVWLEPEG